jgi:hypothetical protein
LIPSELPGAKAPFLFGVIQRAEARCSLRKSNNFSRATQLPKVMTFRKKQTLKSDTTFRKANFEKRYNFLNSGATFESDTTLKSDTTFESATTYRTDAGAWVFSC